MYYSNEVKKYSIYIKRAKNHHVDPINQYAAVLEKKYSKRLYQKYKVVPWVPCSGIIVVVP